MTPPGRAITETAILSPPQSAWALDAPVRPLDLPGRLPPTPPPPELKKGWAQTRNRIGRSEPFEAKSRRSAAERPAARSNLRPACRLTQRHLKASRPN